jgi:hypothetical protein
MMKWLGPGGSHQAAARLNNLKLLSNHGFVNKE